MAAASTTNFPSSILGLDRRTFIGGLTSGAFLARPVMAADSVAKSENPLPGVITRQSNPDNLEYPFSTLDRFFTSNEQFYVRTHFEVPEATRDGWKLKIEGAVKTAIEISYQELRDMPAYTVPALLECSGNGRVYLEPPQTSIRWELGAVSTAEWTGVRLADILERVGVKAEAVDVLLEGADQGEFKKPEPETPGKIHYSRSLPLTKARQPEVILAYKMNGEDLPANHGFPVRAIVPGWYGMASVKWLNRIAVLNAPFHGFFQTFAYSIWQRESGAPTLVPVTAIQVKSQIARPMKGEVVAAGKPYRIYGAAWAGDENVVKVELSVDGGTRWEPARLIGDEKPFCWRFWEYEWKSPTKGRATLLSRATDAKGLAQPMERDPYRRDGVISHVLPVSIEVR